MRHVLVSVVIPVFNGERYLASALQSVQDQEYGPIDVIVVDDGSVDRSADIARSFAGVRYVHQRHQGPAAARNTGIAAARGDLIAFLDSDDTWLPAKLGIQVSQALSHSDVGHISTRMTFILEGGIEPPVWIHPQLLRDQGTDGSLYFPIVSSWLVRRSVFDQIGVFDPRYGQAEDADWLFRAVDNGVRSVALPDVLGHKRIHTQNLSSAWELNRTMVLRAVHASIQRKRRQARPSASLRLS